MWQLLGFGEIVHGQVQQIGVEVFLLQQRCSA